MIFDSLLNNIDLIDNKSPVLYWFLSIGLHVLSKMQMFLLELLFSLSWVFQLPLFLYQLDLYIFHFGWYLSVVASYIKLSLTYFADRASLIILFYLGFIIVVKASKTIFGKFCLYFGNNPFRMLVGILCLSKWKFSWRTLFANEYPAEITSNWLV